MSKEDIDRMVKEAKAHEAEDKKRKDEIDTKNNAEALAYQAEKTIKDLGDKADKAKADEVQKAVDHLKETIKGGNTEAIKKATEELQKPLYELSAAAYQAAGAQQGAPGAGPTGPQPGAQGAGASEKKDDDDVVDAEFTDVNDKK